MGDENADWKVFRNNHRTDGSVSRLADPQNAPPWRTFDGVVVKERKLPATEEEAQAYNERGAKFQADTLMIEMVNAALYLRRPLLITGKPGSGKSSLIYAVARELRLGEVLRWPITSRSTLKDGLYEYDAIGRLHHKQFGADVDDIAPFLKLKSLGTALLPTNTPRALLIDEIDKSDIDLPNDLLNVFEEGEFSIPELERLSSGGRPIDIRSADPGNETFPIFNGHIKCRAFPFVVMTSNGEREFPAPFLRRCVRLQMPEPDKALLTKVVEAHLGPDVAARAEAMIEEFASDSIGTARATDQLLNAVFLLTDPARRVDDSERTRLRAVLQADLLA